ncbi:MAG: ABC transporter ATP-binding protein [Kiritimatiellia bacterium]|jgi:ABC-type sugar transport system ATPase subunit|nr:ABC transporter ATP-binding protein [Kiritimatiellia bacterium]MDP6631067.1 ABC transporter ATP-binding protein [Kiritimatiellia bacterium]MDP6810023.1 ABC transporter ATP-binding protein [Kiritimatiellia bacterium]MDP7024794.1 ABC transporter ATP-binding protein [Kiritimatiellia bacterium]
MIKLENIHMKQGAFELRDLTLEVPQGAYAVLMGASGAGKTTLIELLCGLRFPQRGRVIIGGRDMTHAVPAAREVGYVPQDGALFKTMTVREQLGFALDLRHVAGDDVALRVREIAEMLDIAHLLDRYPSGLSGGERQRTALGRALSFRPKVLLLDEPLCALDDETRERIMNLLRQVQQQMGVTTLHVTHNRQEAEELGTMGMKIAEGKIIPLDLSGGNE